MNQSSPIKLAKHLELRPEKCIFAAIIRPEKCNKALIIRPEKCDLNEENSKLEIDFLVQADDRIIPIEVKAEENLKSKSLSQFVTIDHADKNLKGLRCSMKPYVDQGWMENIPLYSVLGYFKKQLKRI